MRYDNLSKDQAIMFWSTGWWKGLPARDIVQVQLWQERLIMPFEEYHRLTEEVLGRTVYTNEFGSEGCKRLQREFLGEEDALTLDEIMDLISKGRRISLDITMR